MKIYTISQFHKGFICINSSFLFKKKRWAWGIAARKDKEAHPHDNFVPFRAKIYQNKEFHVKYIKDGGKKFAEINIYETVGYLRNGITILIMKTIKNNIQTDI